MFEKTLANLDTLGSYENKPNYALYSTSQQVERLDRFVSHSWTGHRTPKVIALLVNANLIGATIVSAGLLI